MYVMKLLQLEIPESTTGKRNNSNDYNVVCLNYTVSVVLCMYTINVITKS